MNAHFNVAGGRFWGGFSTTVLNSLASIHRFTTSLLKGDVIGSAWNKIKAILNQTAGNVLRLPRGAVGKLVEALTRPYVLDKVKGVSKEYTGVMENTLQSKIAQALQLDTNGERQFVLKKGFIDLVRQLGDSADIWLSNDPLSEREIALPRCGAGVTRDGLSHG